MLQDETGLMPFIKSRRESQNSQAHQCTDTHNASWQFVKKKRKKKKKKMMMMMMMKMLMIMIEKAERERDTAQGGEKGAVNRSQTGPSALPAFPSPLKQPEQASLPSEQVQCRFPAITRPQQDGETWQQGSENTGPHPGNIDLH